jgi:hypothetical protein
VDALWLRGSLHVYFAGYFTSTPKYLKNKGETYG